MMDEERDNFSWARKLGFSQSGCTDSILLNKGIIGLLWDDSSKLLHHPKDVMEARKNILLYKLQNNIQDPRIKLIKNTDRLIGERCSLNLRIMELEEKYKNQESKTIKKENQLRLIRQSKESPNMKRELLKMKVEQIQEILKDSKTMLNICGHLMPSNSKDISQKEIRECLNLMNNIRSGSNKKQIISKITQILGTNHVPSLWSLLLESQTQDMESLIKLGKKEVPEFKTTIGEDIDIGLAKICGENTKIISVQLLEMAKNAHNEKILMDWIEKIEMAEPDVNEWLEFALEVRMLEVEQNILHKEMNDILNNMSERESSEMELAELSSRLENLSFEKQKLIDDVQKSLGYFKGIRYLTTETREKQLLQLQTIAILRSDIQEPNFYQWQNLDLSMELEVFYKELNMEALRQITLRKQIVEQRHSKNSFNQAWMYLSRKLSEKLPSFLLIQKSPFYFLLESYKALYTNILLKQAEGNEPFELRNDYQPWDVERLESAVKSRMELLHYVNLTCQKSKDHVNEFEHIFDIWNRQTIESALTILEELTVDGVTLKEWQQRYSVVMYMLKKSSKVSLSFQPYNFEER